MTEIDWLRWDDRVRHEIRQAHSDDEFVKRIGVCIERYRELLDRFAEGPADDA